MSVLAHRYLFGQVPLGVHDSIVEGLANGAVVATIAWMQTVPAPMHVWALGLKYTLARAFSTDPECQAINIGPALLMAGEGTCIEWAIYEAARLQIDGRRTWVSIVRQDADSPAHAVVIDLDQPEFCLDPIKEFAS